MFVGLSWKFDLSVPSVNKFNQIAAQPKYVRHRFSLTLTPLRVTKPNWSTELWSRLCARYATTTTTTSGTINPWERASFLPHCRSADRRRRAVGRPKDPYRSSRFEGVHLEVVRVKREPVLREACSVQNLKEIRPKCTAPTIVEL